MSAHAVLVRTVLALSVSVWASATSAAASAAEPDVRDSWSLRPGFKLEVDTTGYVFPTSIAFVREPGTRPDDPLYFVAEIDGAVKVVTNDRSVRTFARISIGPPEKRLPAFAGETGLGALCLDQRHGLVFATYAAPDARNVLRNHIVRFDSRPGTFGLRPRSRREIAPVLARFPTAPSHQIGGCAVAGDSLFVGIGDASDLTHAGKVGDLAGKIVRMTLAGAPHPENPFVRRGGAAAYVYALGLRNPFGLFYLGGSLYATQNGASVDTLFRVARGADYGWDGTDASIATNALAVISPSVGPVQLGYEAKDGTALPPEYRRAFYFATSTFSGERGAGVMMARYDERTGRVVKAPSSFVRFRGSRRGGVAGVALGKDGLYFAPLFARIRGKTPVLKVVPDATASYPHVIGRESLGKSLFASYGCRSCHTLEGTGGTIGPSLDAASLGDRLFVRLNSKAYQESVARVDRIAREPFSSFRNARHEVLAADGVDRTAVWIKFKLLQPNFDNPKARMPKLGLNERQAEALRDLLLARRVGAAAPQRSLYRRGVDALKTKKFALGLVAGIVLTSLAALALELARRRQRLP
jgi:glucose/arabinose dehydrogenase